MNVDERRKYLPNGLRYPLVGGTRERHFAGTHFKPRKEPENAQTPTSRVHAVLGGVNIFHGSLLFTSNLARKGKRSRATD
jgi:hypothetical protein